MTKAKDDRIERLQREVRGLEKTANALNEEVKDLEKRNTELHADVSKAVGVIDRENLDLQNAIQEKIELTRYNGYLRGQISILKKIANVETEEVTQTHDPFVDFTVSNG